jgi:hypothetical protein
VNALFCYFAAGVAYGEYLNHIREIGNTNTGERVNDYLAAAGLAPGNPWCGAFVTWVLRAALLATVSSWQKPVPLPGLVQSWYDSARFAGAFVKPADALPGYVVLFHWHGKWEHMGILYRQPMEMPEGMVRTWAVEGNTTYPDNQDQAAQREGMFVEARTRVNDASNVAFVDPSVLLFIHGRS